MAPAKSHLTTQHVGLSDGDAVDLGELTLAVIASPGHTPEHCAYLLSNGADPLALFSGGALIAGGVARTDLISPELTDELARAAYRSIRDRLLILPDDLPVYPTHGAGSFCSATPSGDRTTTIGRERSANPLLQAADEDDFVARLAAGLGTYPPYFLRLREVNRRGATVYGSSPPLLVPRSPDELAALIESGAEVVDVRPITRFAAGHIPGSISIELRDQFASWLGWLVDQDRVVVFIADPDQDLSDLVRQSLNIGYEHLGGLLVGGIGAWEKAGHPVSRISIIASADIRPGSTVVDVRQTSEWESGHVPGAVHIELGTIPDSRAQFTGEVVVHCGHGLRAMTGASLLKRAGTGDVAVTTALAEELTRVIAAIT
jgi:rhodanese-related sulfurtransferase